MTDAPGSPRAARLASPSWLDARLVLGVLLVLVSVVVGARVLASADRTDTVWAAARDLAPGATLTASDLQQQRVRLVDQQAAYLDASGPAPVGRVVARGLLAGELVPARALRDPADVPYRQVTVPVASGHAPPDLRAGQLVDLYVTPDDAAGRPAASPAPAAARATRLVLSRLAVASVPQAAAFGAAVEARSVVLNVAPDDVLALVAALSTGTVDLVRLPADAAVAAQAAVTAPVERAVPTPTGPGR